MEILKVLNLGWGVQSWTLAAMVALGELETVDLAIHSDTTWERSATYEFAEQWTPWLANHGVKVVTVRDEAAARGTKVHVPAFTAGEGVHGQIRRQCTNDWKIQPIRRYISEELDRRGLKKSPGIVEQWLGISLDEWHRAKDPDVRYIQNRYPLLEMEMSRQDCVRWLINHGLPVPPKSSCVFCPYHGRKAWQEMKREGGADWEIALEYDAQIRNIRPPNPLFIHPACKPLADAVDIPEDHGMVQSSLLEECDSGHCFL